MSITFLLCGDRAARSAAETPTGPAPMMARSNFLSETESDDTAAFNAVVGGERCTLVVDDDDDVM